MFNYLIRAAWLPCPLNRPPRLAERSDYVDSTRQRGALNAEGSSGSAEVGFESHIMVVELIQRLCH